MWVFSALVVAAGWGAWAVVIGTFFFGVGVLPMAVIIIVWNHSWDLFFPIAGWGIPLIISRIFGSWIYSKI